jgi:hypothetical protein
MANKSQHHHRHAEMEHHRIRESHKEANRAEKAKEHREQSSMRKEDHGKPPVNLEGGVVRDDHQEGIKRVLQRKGDMEVGQHGKMLQHDWNKDPSGRKHY